MSKPFVLALLLLVAAAQPVQSAEPPARPTPDAAKPADKVAAWGKLASEDGKLSFSLTKPVVIIGSGKDADVRLDNPTVAPQHARLTHKAGVVEIEDLGSKTGTLVAGTALKKGKPFRILQRVDVAVGAVALVFEFGERPGLLPPTQAPAKGKGKGEKKSAPAAPASPAGRAP